MYSALKRFLVKNKEYFNVKIFWGSSLRMYFNYQITILETIKAFLADGFLGMLFVLSIIIIKVTIYTCVLICKLVNKMNKCNYSTVTDFARFLGLSTSQSRCSAA